MQYSILMLSRGLNESTSCTLTFPWNQCHVTGSFRLFRPVLAQEPPALGIITPGQSRRVWPGSGSAWPRPGLLYEGCDPTTSRRVINLIGCVLLTTMCIAHREGHATCVSLCTPNRPPPRRVARPTPPPHSYRLPALRSPSQRQSRPSIWTNQRLVT